MNVWAEQQGFNDNGIIELIKTKKSIMNQPNIQCIYRNQGNRLMVFVKGMINFVS